MRSFWNMLNRNKPLIGGLAPPPPSPRSEIVPRQVSELHPHIFAISDVGRVRDHNEDLYYVSPHGDWFAVADGMGGHEAGEVAAALTIEAIVEYLTPERIGDAQQTGDPSYLLRDAMIAADKRVYEANRKRQGTEMGCTIAVAALINGLVTCHVGDVRVYLQRGDKLRQLTQDHSTVAELVKSGQLAPEEARTHLTRNEVLQAIGMPSGARPDVSRVDLVPGDRILVCSDGLWEAFPNEQIESVLSSDGTMRQLASQLVDRANSADGSDNITVVLFEATRLGENWAAEDL
jgi:protein phosphatase